MKLNGQALQTARVPLPGGDVAIYSPSGLDSYGHADWLGSQRLASTPGRTVSYDLAYAPFGENYVPSGLIR
jgi:hypothetical protein